MIEVYSPKERLLRVLKKEKVERPPVICPGGMMNAAIVEIMQKTGHTLPEAHHSDPLMSSLAADVWKYTGFENFGIPFCMTVEAEALGSKIDFGSLKCEPKIQQEAYPSVSDVYFYAPGTLAKSSRVEAITAAITNLSDRFPDIPVIGSLTGPISTAASLVDPMTFLKQLCKDKENSHRLIDYVCGHLIEYASLLVEAGVTVISIADPTATGEILGPKLFEEYAVRYINQVADAIHLAGMGALERFEITDRNEISIHVIGDVPAAGICGSGLLDIVGELVRIGIIGSNGKFQNAQSGNYDVRFEPYIKNYQGKPAFEVSKGIFLTQKDIRQVQLAKGAIRAGVEALLLSQNTSAKNVDLVQIAGSFGYHLKAESLINIGLLPPEFDGKIEFVGNTSKTGGIAFLLNSDFRSYMENLVGKVTSVELANRNDFDRLFIGALNF